MGQVSDMNEGRSLMIDVRSLMSEGRWKEYK